MITILDITYNKNSLSHCWNKFSVSDKFTFITRYFVTLFSEKILWKLYNLISYKVLVENWLDEHNNRNLSRKLKMDRFVFIDSANWIKWFFLKKLLLDRKISKGCTGGLVNLFFSLNILRTFLGWDYGISSLIAVNFLNIFTSVV